MPLRCGAIRAKLLKLKQFFRKLGNSALLHAQLLIILEMIASIFSA